MKTGKTISRYLWMLLFSALILWCGGRGVYAQSGGSEDEEGLVLPDLPVYMTAEEDLSFTVEKPADSDGISVDVWYDMNDMDENTDPTLFHEDGDENISVHVEKEKLEPGMVIRIHAGAWIRNEDYTFREWRLPVIGSIDEDISLSMGNDVDPENLLINQNIQVKVSAEGMNQVQFYDGYSLWGIDEPDWDGAFTRDISHGDPESFVVYARVRYEEDGPWSYSRPVEFKAHSNGQVGAFQLNVDNPGSSGPITVSRGTILTGTFTASDHADNYRIDAEQANNEEENKWDWYTDLTNQDDYGPVSISTAKLEPGKYRLIAKATGLGYEEYGTWDQPVELIITDPEIPETGILFGADKTSLESGEKFILSAYAADAESFDIFFNYADGDESWTNDRYGDSFSDSWDFGASGSYEVYVRAYFEGGSHKDSEKITFTVTAPNGEFDFSQTQLPVSVAAGEGLSWILQKPAGADRIRGDVWFELDDYEGDDGLFNEDGNLDSMNIRLTADQLKEGMTLRVSLEAWGRGYEYGWQEWRIPVTGKKDDKVTLELINVDDPGKILVNEDFRVRVHAQGMTQVQLYDGYGFWDVEEPDEDGDFTRDISHGDVESFPIYARVRYEDDGPWSYSQPVQITTYSRGKVGSFRFAVDNPGSSGPITVSRGDFLTATFTESEHADHYWISAEILRNEEEDEWDYCTDLIHEDYPGEVTFSTADLEPGRYRLVAKANGPGYEEYGTWDQTVDLIVTDAELPADGILFKADKISLETGERYHLSAYAPDAEGFDIIFKRTDGDDNWTDYRGGDSFSDSWDFGARGTYEVYVKAYYQDGSHKGSDKITFTVTAPKGNFDFSKTSLPAAVSSDEDVTFTLLKPKGAEGIRGDVWFDLRDHEGDNGLFYDESDQNSMDVRINKDRLIEGMTLHVEFEAWGRGYDACRQEWRIAVIGRTDDKVTLQLEDVNDPDHILVNQNFQVRVHAEGMTQVQLYDGYGFWNEEEPDRDGDFTREIGFGETGTFTLYAKVRIGDEWITSEPLSVTISKTGNAGSFDILTVNDIDWSPSMDPVTVKQTDFVRLTFSESSNASIYDLRVWNEESDEEYRDYRRTVSGNLLTLDAGSLPVGTWRIWINAFAEGIAGVRSNNSILLNVTDAEIGENEVVLSVSGNEVQTGEIMRISAMAGFSSDRIAYYVVKDGEERDPDRWDWVEDGNSINTGWSFPNSGTYKIYAIAWKGDESVRSTELTVKVGAPNGKLEFDWSTLPQHLYEGVDAVIPVSLPEEARELYFEMWDETDPDGFYYDKTVSGQPADQVITIKGKNIIAGHKYHIHYEMLAVGYDGVVGDLSLVAGYNPPVTRSIKLIWDDDNNAFGFRKEVTASLDDEIVTILNEENNWTSTVENLPTYNPDGTAAVYKWTVQVPDHYDLLTEKEAEGIYTLKLNYTPPANDDKEDAEAEAAKKAAEAEAARKAAEAKKAQEAEAARIAALNPINGLAAYETPVILKKGASKTVTVLVTAKDNTRISTDQAVVTSSKNTAKVSAVKLAKGQITFKVKGAKAGKAVITVKAGSKTVKVNVTVLKKANAAKSVKAAKKTVNVKSGKTVKIVFKITAKDAKSITTDVLKASSSKTAVASVTKIAPSKGKVTVTVSGLKKGKSNLTMKVGGKKAKVTVNVK